MYCFFKPFILYTTLLTVLAIGSCTCGLDAVGDIRPLPQSITILLCTANVQFFQDAQPDAVLPTLAALRQETDELVIFGLQETNASDLSKMRQALSDYQVYDYRKTASQLSNTVLVYNKTQLKIEYSGMDLPTYEPTPPRYATVLNFPDINFKLVNTHLLGGRFDDETWYKHPSGRKEQMKAILELHPTIIMGDFNADNTPDAELGSYWTNHLKKFLHLQPELSADVRKNAEDTLKSYIYSVHTELAIQDYIPILTRGEIGTTVGRGGHKGVVDWMYATKKTQYEIVNFGLIKAIEQNLSDHNFLWIRIRVKVLI